VNLQKGSLEHIVARANYFKGLVMKTTDPVYWEAEQLIEAKNALAAARDHGKGHIYQTALAMIESAVHKASIST
jgi:hypothetical protein